MTRGLLRVLAFGGWVLVVAGGASASGCAKAKAATVPNGPPLATPAPPPREFVPVEDVAAAPVGTATPDAPTAAVPRPGTTPARPPARPQVGTAKPDPVAVQPPAPAATAEPPRELRAAPGAAAAAEERKVRDVLNRTAAELKRVDYGRLSVERKLQYEQSRRFAEQADQALKDRNVPYAMTLADKAKQLADELAALR